MPSTMLPRPVTVRLLVVPHLQKALAWVAIQQPLGNSGCHQFAFQSIPAEEFLKTICVKWVQRLEQSIEHKSWYFEKGGEQPTMTNRMRRVRTS